MSGPPAPGIDNGVPKWLAIVGHVIALLLVALIVFGLSGVVVDALRDGTVGGTYRNQRYEFQRLESPIAYWLFVLVYAGFPCVALWAIFTETLPGLWKRIRS
jgi:hypothetical protein